MPPLIKYEFVDDNDTNIVIRAYNYEEAMTKLTQTVKHPADFIYINN